MKKYFLIAATIGLISALNASAKSDKYYIFKCVGSRDGYSLQYLKSSNDPIWEQKHECTEVEWQPVTCLELERGTYCDNKTAGEFFVYRVY